MESGCPYCATCVAHLHVSSHHPAWWGCTNCGAKFPLSTSPLHRSYSETGGTPSEHHMYDNIRRELYLMQVSNDAHMTVGDCRCYSKDYVASRGNVTKICSSSKRSLANITMNILDPFPKLADGNELIIVIADRYMRLTGAIPLSKITVQHFRSIFIDHRIVQYGIYAFCLPNSSQQL